MRPALKAARVPLLAPEFGGGFRVARQESLWASGLGAIIQLVKISQLGEFGLIDRVAKKIATAAGRQPEVWGPVKIGIGDDAAVWEASPGLQLATTDTLVQDVHFSLDTAGWDDLGWKALAVNVSDVGAMGGVPRYALVTLALPPATSVEDIERLYDGMLEAARAYNVAIVGGDMVTAPIVVITVGLWGVHSEGSLLTRSGARPGDEIAVTGRIGDSAGGLAAFKGEGQPSPEASAYMKKAHLRPKPRLAEGQALARLGVKAAIDISDGLVADLGHICEASNVSAVVRVDALPVSMQLQEALGDRATEKALFGGEDYELLFTAPQALMQAVKASLECPVTVIGEVVPAGPAKVDLLDRNGRILPWGKGGWDHFAPGR
ncbi:MAG: thiamine-phosphate kinase [Chloroflexi bacterium]|nr:thiamine-phosphate kinase [Chloroflexota bacterium]